MTIGNRLTSLCFPAQVYFIISIISILGILSQNAIELVYILQNLLLKIFGFSHLK